MVQMGDEGHNRNRAGTLMFLRDMLPLLAESTAPPRDVAAVARFIGGNDHFFLNLVMPACKLALDAARDVPGSTLVVAMARNGTDFGIQLAGCGDAWFTAPAAVPEGLYLGAYGAEDANPDIGDSAITETAGLGGFAMAAAPAIVRFVGGAVADAIRTTRTCTRSPSASTRSIRFPCSGSAAHPSASTPRGSSERAFSPRSTRASPAGLLAWAKWARVSSGHRSTVSSRRWTHSPLKRPC